MTELKALPLQWIQQLLYVHKAVFLTMFKDKRPLITFAEKEIYSLFATHFGSV